MTGLQEETTEVILLEEIVEELIKRFGVKVASELAIRLVEESFKLLKKKKEDE